MQISQIYCSHCGAANEKTSTLCFACSSPLSQEVETPESAAVLLNQRYRVLTSVGIGGFGTIYKVQDIQRANALFAVKQINLTGLSATQIIATTEAFHREVRMLSSLHHENLLRIYDSFTDPHHWYMVMDFIEGETLEQYLAVKSMVPRSPGMPLMPINEIIAIAMQLCAVLGYLHKQQPPIVFRDLKPSNIMRTKQGHLFLIDFGIARQFKPGKAKDTLPLGSPGYAPPEQYGKAQTTPRADVYSFGVLLHQFLSGDDPSEHSFQFAPLRMYGGSDLAELDTLIQRMVHPHPEQRPTIDEVKAIFQRLQSRYLWQSPLPGNIFPVSQLQAPIAWQQPPGTSINSSSPIRQQQQVPFPQASMVPGQQPSRRRFIRLGVGATIIFSAGWFASSWFSHGNAQFGKTPTATIQQRSPTAAPASDSPGVLWIFEIGGLSILPVVANDVVYAAADNWNLYAINAITGQQKWSFTTETAAIMLLVADGVAYVASNDGDLYAVNAITGQQKWSFPAGGFVHTPIVANDIVYIVSYDGNVYAVDAPTGRQKWSSPNSSILTLSSGMAYIGLTDGNLCAVDAITGKEKWACPVGIAVSGSPISLTVANGAVYIGLTDGNLYAVDIMTGVKKWFCSVGNVMGDFFTSTIVNGVVYVGSFNGDLYAIDAETGRKKWAFATGNVVSSTPTVSNGVVYIGSNDNNFYAIDAETGKKKWAFATGNAVEGQATVVDDVVYVGSIDKNVYAIDIATGKKKWAFLTDEPIYAALTVANGVIYVGSSDGYLYALITS